MSKTYRIGALGFAHGHIFSILQPFANLPNVKWVACADTVPAVPSRVNRTGRAIERAQAFAQGAFTVYDDWHEMLDKETFDIVLFCPENSSHGVVAEAIAAHGAHMITEKPMSSSLSDALRMARAATYNDVKLMINWPTTWSPAVRKVKELIEQGIIGDVLEVKWRNGGSMGPLSYSEPQPTPQDKGASWWHQAAPGGGAMLDYCCYGACLSRWYIGEQAVSAVAIKANLTSHYGDADDNAIMSVRFPRALGLLEATWTTWNMGVPNGPIVYGTKGALVVSERSGVNVYTSRAHGLTEPDQFIEGDPLPAGQDNPATAFIHHLETGEPLHPTLDMDQNLEVMAILDAGIRSTASGKVELVNDANWCIG